MEKSVSYTWNSLSVWPWFGRTSEGGSLICSGSEASRKRLSRGPLCMLHRATWAQTWALVFIVECVGIAVPLIRLYCTELKACLLVLSCRWLQNLISQLLCLSWVHSCEFTLLLQRTCVGLSVIPNLDMKYTHISESTFPRAEQYMHKRISQFYVVFVPTMRCDQIASYRTEMTCNRYSQKK